MSKSSWIELKAEAEKFVPENVQSKKVIVESYIHLTALDRYAGDLLGGNHEKYKSLFDDAPQFHINEIKRITKQ